MARRVLDTLIVAPEDFVPRNHLGLTSIFAEELGVGIANVYTSTSPDSDHVRVAFVSEIDGDDDAAAYAEGYRRALLRLADNGWVVISKEPSAFSRPFDADDMIPGYRTNDILLFDPFGNELGRASEASPIKDAAPVTAGGEAAPHWSEPAPKPAEQYKRELEEKKSTPAIMNVAIEGLPVVQM